MTRYYFPGALLTLFVLAGCETSGTQTAAPAPTAPATSGPVVGQPPTELADLVGARAAGGETQMGMRGYTVARQQGLTAFWWNPTTQICAKTVTNNGRYETVATATRAECGM